MKKQLLMLGLIFSSVIGVFAFAPLSDISLEAASKLHPGSELQKMVTLKKDVQSRYTLTEPNRTENVKGIQTETPAAMKAEVLPSQKHWTPWMAPEVSKELREVPAEVRMEKKNTRKVDAEWGEWYDYSSGTLDFGEPFITDDLFGEGSYPKTIKVQRRDAKGDPTASQIKFVGGLGDLDIVGDYDPETYSLTIENIDLGKKFSTADFGYNVEFGVVDAPQFNKNWKFSATVWFYVMPGMGYRAVMSYVPADANEFKITLNYDMESVNAESVTLSMSKYSGDAVEMRYTIMQNANGYWVAEADKAEGVLTSIYELLNTKDASLNITTVPAAEFEGYTKNFKFEKSGPWYLYFAFYDAEGYRVTYGYADAIANLKEEGKWQNIGKGTYTDMLYHSLYTTYILNNDLVGTLPDWMDTYSWEVDVEESVTTPGLYRIPNPYRGDCPYGTLIAKYENTEYSYTYELSVDPENDYYIILHGENPEYPWTEYTNSGLVVKTVYSDATETGTLYNRPAYTTNEGVNVNFYISPTATPNMTFKNMKFEGSWETDTRKFSVTLPGYINFDIEFVPNKQSLYADFSKCAVSYIKYLPVMFGEMTAEEAFEAIKSGTDENVKTLTGSGDVDVEGLEVGRRYYIYSVNYDEDGEVVAEQQYLFTPQEHQFSYIGTAIYHDELLFDYDFYVDVYRDKENLEADVFYIHNPYVDYNVADMSFDNFMEVDCTDPGRVKLSLFNSGVTIDDGYYWYESAGAYYEEHGSSPEDIPANYYGKFEWGFADFGQMVICINKDWGFYPAYNYLEYIPGYVDMRVKIVETIYGFELIFCENARKAVYTVVPYEDVEDATEALMSGNYGDLIVKTATESGMIDLSAWDFESFKEYAIVAVSLTADDKGAYSTYYKFYGAPEELCDAKVTASFFNAFAAGDYNYDGKVYTSSSTPDIYYVEVYCQEMGAGRYIVVDCCDPAKVYIKESNVKINGIYDLMSYPAVPEELGIEILDEHYGTFDGEKIVIPGNTLVLKSGNLYYDLGKMIEDNEDFVVEFGEISGVENVSIDTDCAPVYYDLMGRKVVRPQVGQIYIERRGETARKILF